MYCNEGAARWRKRAVCTGLLDIRVTRVLAVLLYQFVAISGKESKTFTFALCPQHDACRRESSMRLQSIRKSAERFVQAQWMQ